MVDHRRPAGARRLCPLGRRVRPRRRPSSSLLRAHHALVGDRLLERRHRLLHHAVCPRSGGDRACRPSPRLRGDEPITASTAITIFVRNEPPDRVIRNLDAMMREIELAGAASSLPSLRPERHQPERYRRARGNRLRRARRAMARPHPGDLPPPHRQHRLQGGKFLGLLRALGRPARIRRHARHRQLHDRRGDHADGARDAGRSEARHSSGPGGGPALDQRLRAHLPVRHAARHALMDDRQRLVAGRLRTLLGPQRHHPHRAVRRALPHPEAAGAAACSAAMC